MIRGSHRTQTFNAPSLLRSPELSRSSFILRFYNQIRQDIQSCPIYQIIKRWILKAANAAQGDNPSESEQYMNLLQIIGILLPTINIASKYLLYDSFSSITITTNKTAPLILMTFYFIEQMECWICFYKVWIFWALAKKKSSWCWQILDPQDKGFHRDAYCKVQVLRVGNQWTYFIFVVTIFEGSRTENCNGVSTMRMTT